ncbi:ankyrin repeat domain-containing protein [Virgibacillus proomii]|uniref:ankyrin repeat domain-containing protein n=1 Tax=Virgibacillus proomii TaxID=84407 RepID=UPI0009857B2C|nr:ankyrin repeat domain-containing protein [Virgibacillus proomii]
MNYFKLLQNNDIEALGKYLNKHDANEEIQGQSLLYWSVYMGNMEFTKLLIESGADVNREDKLGRTPLEISSYFGFTEVAELLLKHDAKVISTCMDRAYFGWDRNVQSDVLDLFQKYGWLNIYLMIYETYL